MRDHHIIVVFGLWEGKKSNDIETHIGAGANEAKVGSLAVKLLLDLEETEKKLAKGSDLSLVQGSADKTLSSVPSWWNYRNKWLRQKV